MKRTVRDLSDAECRGRRALVRVDYNVPLDGADGVADAWRVEASFPTLRFLLEREVRPVLASHLGRPGGRPDPSLSLRPLLPLLEEGLEVRARFAAPADGRDALEASRSLAPGEVLLLENTRFLPGETANDAELAGRLAALGELFVQDAFGSLHRAHASTVGVAARLRPAVAGLLVEGELEALDRLRGEPRRPFVVALGGAKIADKLQLLERFAREADRLLVGGAVANTFLRAAGRRLGASLVEEDALEAARRVREMAGERLLLPEDLVVTPDTRASPPEWEVVGAGDVPPEMAAVDLGPRTRRRFREALAEGVGTLFWNGPMGLIERPPFDEGTRALAEAVAAATEAGAFTVVGGGDSAAALRRAGLARSVTHVSTGGGAALEYVAGRTLPGVAALDDAPPPDAGGQR